MSLSLGFGLGLSRGGARGFESGFDSDSGVRAALILDYSGRAGGRFFANGDNTKTFGDLHTFTRPSLAMQRNTSGEVAWAAHNLLKGSEHFENSTPWSTDNGSSASGVTAPDGGSDAVTFTEDGTTDTHGFVATAGNRPTGAMGDPYHCQVWIAKASTRRYVVLGADTSTPILITFDVQTGTITDTEGTLLDSGVEEDGDFYRVWLEYASGATTPVFILRGSTSSTNAVINPSYTGDSKTIIAWGGQLNKMPMADAIGTHAPSYVPSTSATVAGDNQPRLDHDKDGNRIGLLVEEERTNKCLQSAALGTTWTIPGANTALTSYATAGVFGTTTAEDVKHGDSAETIQQTITVTDNTKVAISAFVHQGTTGAHDWVKLAWMVEAAGTNGFEAWFDLSGTPSVGTAQATGTGSYTANSAKIENYGSGWYRISAVGQIVTGQTAGRLELINTTADGVDTAEATNSVAWEGFGLEEGTFVTSHIPTTTVAVTRAAEVVEVDISGMVFYRTGSVSTMQQILGNPVDMISPDSSWSEIGGYSDFGIDTRTTERCNMVYRNPLTDESVTRLGNTLSSGELRTVFKFAGAAAANDFATSFNGTTALTSSSVVPVNGYGKGTKLSLGVNAAQTSQFNMHLQQHVIYAARLSNADLEAMTTL